MIIIQICFFYNFAGYSGKFIFGFNSSNEPEIYTLPFEKLKIKYEIDIENHKFVKFFITTPEGTKYSFENFENTKSIIHIGGQNQGVKNHNTTSWYLSKIESVNNDVIYFFYDIENIKYRQWQNNS